MTGRKFAFRMAALGKLLLVVFPCAADTLPFWYDDSPMTNRVAASSASVALVAGFESRDCSSLWARLMSFTSEKLGFCLFIH